MLLNEMEIFYYVVEQQSFSKAADKLGVSKSFISKKITKLEKDLKTSLLARNTRQLTLTEAGQSFYEFCANVVNEASQAYTYMSKQQGKPGGTLTISAPSAFVLNLLVPMIAKYITQYPEVNLDIQLEHRVTDIIKDGIDLALRFAVLKSSNLIAQRIYTGKSILCATPKYFKDHKQPDNPDDLKQHNFALYRHAKTLKYIKLIKDNSENIVNVQGNFTSNNLELVKKILLSHLCIGILPEFMISEELKNKQIISCLNDYQLPVIQMYAIYPEKQFTSPKVKEFINMMKDFLG